MAHMTDVNVIDQFEGDGWMIYNGDSAEVLQGLPDHSIDLSVCSIPFASLYSYSSTDRDLGNSKDHEQFFVHMAFIIKEWLRVTKPGRIAAIHVADIAAMQERDGYQGIKDFSGQTIFAFERAGWIFHGRCTIAKNPQASAIRTHAKGLLFKQLKKDASWLRPTLSDYMLWFRAPGDNAVAICPDVTNEEWIAWANNVWTDIRETNTLHVAEARESDDDRHICPLQLDVIDRCIRLWSNPGEIVLSPFAGIGSEGYMALKLGRRFIGIELKPIYAKTAAKNLERALAENAMEREQDLFSQDEPDGT